MPFCSVFLFYFLSVFRWEFCRSAVKHLYTEMYRYTRKQLVFIWLCLFPFFVLLICLIICIDSTKGNFPHFNYCKFTIRCFGLSLWFVKVTYIVKHFVFKSPLQTCHFFLLRTPGMDSKMLMSLFNKIAQRSHTWGKAGPPFPSPPSLPSFCVSLRGMRPPEGHIPLPAPRLIWSVCSQSLLLSCSVLPACGVKGKVP